MKKLNHIPVMLSVSIALAVGFASCKKEAKTDNNPTLQPASSLSLDSGSIQQHIEKLDDAVKQQYQNEELMLTLLTVNKDKQKFALPSTLKQAMQMRASSVQALNEKTDTTQQPDPAIALINQFSKIEVVAPEEGETKTFFELDSNNQKAFLQFRTATNGQDLQEKIKIAPDVVDEIKAENKAFSRTLQAVFGTSDPRVLSQKRGLSIQTFSKLQSTMQAFAKEERQALAQKQDKKALGGGTYGPTFSNFQMVRDGLLAPAGRYVPGRMLLHRSSAPGLLWTAGGTPGHVAILAANNFSVVKNENTSLGSQKMTIGAYPQNSEFNTSDGVQWEPVSVWGFRSNNYTASEVYLMAGVKARWVRCGRWWQVWCWTRQTYEDMGAYAGVVDEAKIQANKGRPYRGFNNKTQAPGKFNCSTLAWYCYYYRAGIDISTWYEWYPTPSTIFRDDETIVIASVRTQ